MTIAKLKLWTPSGEVIFDSSADRVLSYLGTTVQSQNFPKSSAGAPSLTAHTFRLYDSRITPTSSFALVKILTMSPPATVGGQPWTPVKEALTRVEYFAGYLDYTIYVSPNFSNAYTLSIRIKLYRR